MFCCRELLFSKLFYRHQQQQPPPPVLRAAAGNAGNRIFRPCSSFRAMVFCCRGLLFSKLFYRHQQQQPQATESLDKCCFSRFFYVREFFRVVLDLARPSEPWCFAAGSCFFRSCFTGISSSSRRHQFCEQPQVTESFDLARPSELWCFAAGGCFFRSCFTGISSSNRRHQSCEQPQATESLDNLSTMCCFSRISDDTLGSFLAWFWTLLVLQSHGVLLPGAAFFEAVLPASAAAAATSSASSRRQQNLSTNAVFLDFQTTR